MSHESIELRIDGVDADIHVLTGEVEERIGAPITARAIGAVTVGDGPGALGDLDPIGRDATLVLRHHGVERTFALRVEAVVDRDGHAEVVLASPVARLADTCDYRVFVDRSATEIVAQVLAEHGIRLELRAQRKAPRSAHRLQVFESDLAFSARLLAEEGMSWIPAADDPGLVRVFDAPATYLESGISVPFREEAGLEVGRAIHAARLSARAAWEKVTLRDYDFRHPMLDLQGDAGDGALECSEYPGGFTDPDAGKELAAIRLAQQNADAVTLEGLATEPALAAGCLFGVTDAPLDLPEDRWLVRDVCHVVKTRAGASELGYEARFRAVPASRGFRAPRLSPPARGGVGTAVVTGAPGTETALDEHGRSRVLLRWDRRSDRDEGSSGLARVLQPQLAGSIFNPRVGWEELVAFSDRAGETPMLLGRVFNAVEAPPAALPARGVETHFGSRTTAHGSGGSFVRISDEAGRESLSFNASRDYEERTENDKLVAIAANDAHVIAGERKVIVKERVVEKVDGEQSINVAGLRTLTTGSNYALSAGSERIVVGGVRAIRAGGDYATSAPTFMRVVGGAKQEIGIEHQSMFTTGASSLLVMGGMKSAAGPSESASVAGAAIVKVSGAQIINTGTYALTVRGAYAESFGSRSAAAGGKYGESFGAVTYDVGGAASFAGSEVVFEAAAQLTIKAGGVTVSMTPGSITVRGNFEGSGSSLEMEIHRYG